ncbi:hypothetical protein [Actibacterium sp. D379-3]
MTRKVLDHDRHHDDASRKVQYARIEHEAVPDKSTVALQRRAVETEGKSQRVKQFMRIEKGHKA